MLNIPSLTLNSWLWNIKYLKWTFQLFLHSSWIAAWLFPSIYMPWSRDPQGWKYLLPIFSFLWTTLLAIRRLEVLIYELKYGKLRRSHLVTLDVVPGDMRSSWRGKGTPVNLQHHHHPILPNPQIRRAQQICHWSVRTAMSWRLNPVKLFLWLKACDQCERS